MNLHFTSDMHEACATNGSGLRFQELLEVKW
jgi:hypothetical protein